MTAAPAEVQALLEALPRLAESEDEWVRDLAQLYASLARRPGWRPTSAQLARVRIAAECRK